MAKETNPIDVADELEREANGIILDRGLDSVLRDHGKVFYKGSYFLNVMTWPDLDIDLVIRPDPYSVDAFFELGKELAQFQGVWGMHFRNCISHPHDRLPKGLYWGMRMDRVDSDGHWKVDLWAVDEQCLEEDRAEAEHLLRTMDSDRRKLIIEVKHSLLTPEGRSPMLSSYHVYQAVLVKGLRKKKEIAVYLERQGVSLQKAKSYIHSKT